VPPYTNLLYSFNFYLFGLIAIASAVAFVTRKSPVAAALWLVNTLFCVAALFIMLDAPFVGIIQILVYAGAIMVVFLFVIMLLNLGQGTLVNDARGLLAKLAATGLGLALIAQLAAIRHAQPLAAIAMAPDSTTIIQKAQGAVPPVAAPLFNQYLLAFEVTSVLLLVAIVGAVVIGRRRGEFLGGGSNAR
jgi:NADH-quinone oxidoreductase subunit J